MKLKGRMHSGESFRGLLTADPAAACRPCNPPPNPVWCIGRLAMILSLSH